MTLYFWLFSEKGKLKEFSLILERIITIILLFIPFYFYFLVVPLWHLAVLYALFCVLLISLEISSVINKMFCPRLEGLLRVVVKIGHFFHIANSQSHSFLATRRINDFMCKLWYYLFLQIFSSFAMLPIDFKMFLSMLMIILFFSPLTYIVLFSIVEFFFLPKVSVKSFDNWKDYYESIKPEVKNKNFSLRPQILILYPRRYETIGRFSELVKKIASYNFLIQYRTLLFGRDFLSYKNLTFMVSSFCIFSLFCLADQYLIEKFFYYTIGAKIFSFTSLIRGLHVICFIFWLYFLTRLILFFLPENLSLTLRDEEMNC